MDKNLRLLVRLDAIDKASRPMRGIEKQVRAASDALRLNRAELKKLEAAQRDVAAFRGLKASLEANKRAMLEAQAKTQALAREHARTEAPTRKMTAALTRARNEVKALKTAQEGHARELNQVRGRLDAAGVSTRNLGREELALRNNITRANSAIDQQKTKLKALGDQQRRAAAARDRYGQTTAFAGQAASSGAGALGAGVAVAAPLVIASREAMKFEDAMADVRKVVNFPTPAAFKVFSSELLNMSTRIPVAADGLASIAALGARAGVPLRDLGAFTETAAKMGVAFDLSAEEAGQMMATWRAAFGMGQEQVTQLANQVNALTNSFGGAPAAVSEMVTRIGPLGDVAGVGAGSIAALAQVMNAVGVESEIGATGIKNMMLALTKGTAATKMQKKAFAALGLDAGQISRQMQTDSEGAITKVLEAVSKLPDAQRAGILTQLFGSESVAAIAPLLTRLEDVRRNFRAVGDATFYASSMDKEYAARAATTSNALTLAKNNANALGVEIGTMLLPTIREVSTRIGFAAQHVRNFAAAHPGAAKAIAMVVGGIAAALLIFGALALAVAAVLAPFAAMQLAWALALPLLGTIGGLLAPIIVPLLAVGAAVLAIGLVIRKFWQPLSAFFGGLWKELAPALAPVLSGLGSMAATAARLFMKFTPIGMAIRAVGALFNWLIRPVQMSEDGLRRTGNAGEAVGRALGAAVRFIMDPWGSLMNFFRMLAPRFAEMGGNLIQGLINGVVNKLTALRSTITNAASSAARWFKNTLGIHSPSRVFMAFGRHTMTGLAQGIDQARREPIEALGRIGAAMTGALAIGAGGPALASTAGDMGGPSIRGDTYYKISITAAPGQNAREIADEVWKLIEAKKASQRRSDFRDDDE